MLYYIPSCLLVCRTEVIWCLELLTFIITNDYRLPWLLLIVSFPARQAMAGRYDVHPPSPAVMFVLGTIVMLMIFPVQSRGQAQAPATTVAPADSPDTCGVYSTNPSPAGLKQASVALPNRLYVCQSRTLGSIPYGQYRRHWHRQTWNIILPVSEANRPTERNRLPWTSSITFSERVQIGRVQKGQYDRNLLELYSETHNFSGLAEFSMFGGFRAPLVDMSFEFFADKLMAVLYPQPTVMTVSVNCGGCASSFVLDPVGGSSPGPGAAMPIAPGGRRAETVRGRNANFRDLAPGVVFEPAGRGQGGQGTDQGVDGGLIAGIVIAILVLAGILIIVFYIWWKRKTRTNQRKQQEQMVAERRRQQVKPHLITAAGNGRGGGTMDRKPTFRDIEAGPEKPDSMYDARRVQITPSGKYDPIPSNTRGLTTQSAQLQEPHKRPLDITVSSLPATQPDLTPYEDELYQNHMADHAEQEIENAVQPGPMVIAELSSELYTRKKFANAAAEEEPDDVLPRQRMSTLSAQEMRSMSIKKPITAPKPDRPPRSSDGSSSRMSSLRKFVRRLPPEGIAALNQLQRPKTPVNENPLDGDGYIVPDIKSPGSNSQMLGQTLDKPPPRPFKSNELRRQSRVDIEDIGARSPTPPPRSVGTDHVTPSRRGTIKSMSPGGLRRRSNTNSTSMILPLTGNKLDRTQTASTTDSGFLGSAERTASKGSTDHSLNSEASPLDDYQNPIDARSHGDGHHGGGRDSPIDYENLQFAGESDEQSRHDYVEPLDKLASGQQSSSLSGGLGLTADRLTTLMTSYQEDLQAYSEVEMDGDLDSDQDTSPPRSVPVPPRFQSSGKPPKPEKSATLKRKAQAITKSNVNNKNSKANRNSADCSVKTTGLYDPSLFGMGGIDYKGQMDIVYDNVSDADGDADSGPEYEMTGKPASLAAEKDIDGIYTYAGLPRTHLTHIKEQKQNRPRTAMAAMKSLRKKKT